MQINRSWALTWLLVVCCVGGCSRGPGGSSAAPHGDDGGKLKICLLPKIKGIAYFSSCAEGAREAADELGNVELIYDGPTDGDPKKQAEMIEQWTVDGVDVICVAPNAPDVVANAMREAQNAGIQVLTWDADGAHGTRSFFVNQATAQAIGEGMVQAMIEDLGGPDVGGDVVIISADATSANQNAWIDVMKPALARTKLNLVTIKYPGENGSAALADAQDVIKKYPDLKGIFGISSVSFPGAAEAVEQMGQSGRILVTGLSTPNEMKRFVRSGTVKSVILWNTIDLGYLTIHAAESLAHGKLKPGDAAVQAGRLGEKPIAGDNILLGDILVFTAENIDQYDF
ncbi:MAG: substrate-binding domain-containing protein [Planctomycetaceae bacterium]